MTYSDGFEAMVKCLLNPDATRRVAVHSTQDNTRQNISGLTTVQHTTHVTTTHGRQATERPGRGQTVHHRILRVRPGEKSGFMENGGARV